MGAAGRALVAIGLMALTACGSVHPQSTVSTSAVPWLALPPTGVYPTPPNPTPAPPDPIPAGTPACTSSQLEAAVFGQNGAGQNVTTPVVFRNRSSAACYLAGYPDVTILGASGAVMARAAGSAQRGTFFDNDVVVPLLMKPGTSALQPAKTEPLSASQAFVNVEWFVCRGATASRMAIDLPSGGGRMTIPYAIKAPWNGVCDAGGVPSGLTRGQFNPTGIQWPPAPTYLSDTIAIHAPARVKAGSTLVYYVSIANTSNLDYRLNPCPDYNEFLGPKVVVESYRLNCSPVAHIAPASTVTFEMRMKIPNVIGLGPTQLQWVLLDGRIQHITTPAQIEIVQ